MFLKLIDIIIIKEEQSMRLITLRLMPLLLVLLCASSFSYAAGIWEKGRHYSELPYPVATADPAKIEVLELFWYGCPHCYEFNNDHLPKWEAELADDVSFRLLPATFPGWIVHAKAYFAAEFLGVEKKMHQPLFDAIQKAPKKYKDIEDIKPLFIAQGVKSEDFDALFEATGFRKISKIDEAVESATKKIKNLRVSGVPALIINGKYKIGVREAGGFPNMLKIANFLIHKERESLKK
jgi:thiol:disulfide interchange protein DsbA